MFYILSLVLFHSLLVLCFADPSCGESLLNQADPAVEVIYKESGELVLSTAGEVHIERCLTDLRESYCPGVKITVSKPIVPFRETILPMAQVDMTKEQITEENEQFARHVYLLGMRLYTPILSESNRVCF